jgi:hypothetical protein
LAIPNNNKKEGWVMIGNIVDRLHVSASSRDVIRAVRKSLRAPALRRVNRVVRHQYWAALARHRYNQDTYVLLVRGGI